MGGVYGVLVCVCWYGIDVDVGVYWCGKDVTSVLMCVCQWGIGVDVYEYRYGCA